MKISATDFVDAISPILWTMPTISTHGFFTLGYNGLKGEIYESLMHSRQEGLRPLRGVSGWVKCREAWAELPISPLTLMTVEQGKALAGWIELNVIAYRREIGWPIRLSIVTIPTRTMVHRFELCATDLFWVNDDRHKGCVRLL